MRLAALLTLLVTLTLSCAAPDGGGNGDAADLVLRGGKIVTLDDAFGEVEALAVRDGVVVAAGNAADVESMVGANTEVIELDGRTVVPGFVEGHGHFSGIGRSLMNLDLRSAQSWDDVVDTVAAAVAEREPGDWIVGRGWHQDKWDAVPEAAVEGYPVHDALSAVSPDNPVALRHASGHAGIVNQHVIDSAGLASSADPPGGTILRKADGTPTGVLRETAFGPAMREYSEAMDNLSDEESERLARQAVALANEECLKKGVTSFHDAGSPYSEVDRFRTMYGEGELQVRLWVMLNESNESLAASLADYRTVGDAGGRLTVRAIKRVADGALGTHGAWLLEPYIDVDTVGLPTTPVESIAETARIAREHDVQLCVHAIGDRANREVLDVFEDAYAGGDDLRWRVEHAQHLHLDDIPRFGALGVIASMQAVHCTSDAPWVPKRIGDQRSEEGAYVWRDLMESGAVIVNGTDAPVEDVDPLANFISSVTRRTRHGDVFYGDQVMNRVEALESMTKNAAYAAFEEATKGTLAPGMIADLVVLSHDILTVDEAALADTRVDVTVVDGEVVYTAD